MLEALVVFNVVQIVVMVILYLKVKKVQKTLAEPLRRAVTTLGPQMMEPSLTADFFKMKRDLFPKDSSRWKMYDKKLKEALL